MWSKWGVKKLWKWRQQFEVRRVPESAPTEEAALGVGMSYATDVLVIGWQCQTATVILLLSTVYHPLSGYVLLSIFDMFHGP